MGEIEKYSEHTFEQFHQVERIRGGFLVCKRSPKNIKL